jgi:hypothetical protein
MLHLHHMDQSIGLQYILCIGRAAAASCMTITSTVQSTLFSKQSVQSTLARCATCRIVQREIINSNQSQIHKDTISPQPT